MVGGFGTASGFGTVGGFSTVGGFGTDGMVIADITRAVIANANDTWNIPEEHELIITAIQSYFYTFKNQLLGLIILIYPRVFELTRAFVTV